MDLDEFALFKMSKERMDWAARRQEVLAKNIANADTPKYMARDIGDPQFKEMLRRPTETQTAITNPKHMQGPAIDNNSYRSIKDARPYEVSPDGNGVVIEQQMMKVSETKGRHELAANLYQKHLRMLKTSLGRSGQ